MMPRVALRISRTVFSALSGIRLLACLIVAPRQGYDEPGFLSYAIRSFYPTSADGLHEATGSPIITDGEQRVSSFATYPIADTLAGTGLATNLAPGGQFFAIFADGHNRQLPKITGGPFHYNFYAGELVKKAVKIT